MNGGLLNVLVERLGGRMCRRIRIWVELLGLASLIRSRMGMSRGCLEYLLLGRISTKRESSLLQILMYIIFIIHYI